MSQVADTHFSFFVGNRREQNQREQRTVVATDFDPTEPPRAGSGFCRRPAGRH
jgi:hypothetical protein